jgi:hypothetical protein
MNDDFEQRLRRRPLRELPPAWRAEILREARRAAVPDQKRDAGMASLTSHLRRFLSTVSLEPSALLRWSALGAVWGGILVLNLAASDPAPAVAARVIPLSPQTLLALREQQKLFAELIGTVNEPAQPDRPKPRPHSQRRTGMISA